VSSAGQKIRAGDRLMLFYPSANRDESVFEHPFEFRIDRDHSPHLGWGVGDYCLGAHGDPYPAEEFTRPDTSPSAPPLSTGTKVAMLDNSTK
jgi:hypothetical protein